MDSSLPQSTGNFVVALGAPSLEGGSSDVLASGTYDSPIPTNFQSFAYQERTRDTNNGKPRPFLCRYCGRMFVTTQALGGHVNGHKRRKIAKKMKVNADLPPSFNNSFRCMDSPFCMNPRTTIPFIAEHPEQKGNSQPNKDLPTTKTEQSFGSYAYGFAASYGQTSTELDLSLRL